MLLFECICIHVVSNFLPCILATATIIIDADILLECFKCRLGILSKISINELYHELADRVNLEHLDLICEALDCELDELIVRVPNKESAITHTRQGTQKPGRKR